MSTKLNWSESSVLVTGAASGLGAACAAYLHAQGTHVVLGDLDFDGATRVQQRLGASAQACSLDVTKGDEVEAGISAAAAMAPLRGVIHCAGILAASRVIGRQGPHDFDLFRRTIEVNLSGSFNVLRLAAAAMQTNVEDEEGGRGVIVLTASVAAFEGQIGQIAYAASKGGVAGMVLPAARELGKWGIRVAAIAPGVFETPMMQAAPDAVRESLLAQSVYPHRLGNPDEFAALAWHILQNRMLNGSVIRLDGSMRMQAK